MENLIFLALPLLAFLGARTSKEIKITNKFIYIPPLISFAVGWGWIFFAKYTKMSLAIAQILFDTTYILFYFLAFILLGEAITLIQGIGVVLAVSGIILLGL